MMFQDPAIPAGETVVTREWLELLVDNLTYMFCEAGIVPEDAILGGAGQGGYASIGLAAGQILGAQFGALVAAGPPPDDGQVYVLGGSSGGQPTWYEKDGFYERAKRAALLGKY